ncbi:MAG: hypothetical protein NTU67_01620, partial [Gemmatimonadetes bacterium]|nr:hypothetical protein [Gemmatimonadota bacterium]
MRDLRRRTPHRLGRWALIALRSLASATVGTAGAQGGKKPSTQDVYGLWRSISCAALSTDGKWAMYTASPAVGEG